MKPNKIRVEIPDCGKDGWKTQAHRLFEALGGRWNRRRGYHISPSRADLYKRMLSAGWDAGYKGITEPNRLMESPTGERLSVLSAIKTFKTSEETTNA